MSKLPLISRFPAFPALLMASVLLLALTSRPAAAQDRVVLQLRWEHQFQFAGFYAAQWEGYFREAGLEVEIRSAVKPDGKVMRAPKEVAEGRAHFGVGSADILLARDRGAPLVVLGVLAQQSPVIVIARAALNVRKPADLAGLRVRRVPSDRADAEFQAMLRASGVDLSQIRHSTMPYYKTSIYKELAQGTLDAVVTYSLTGLWQAERHGLQVSMLRPASYGVDFYGDSIFTVEQLVRERPQLVERFLQASLRGWRYALDHPKEIADRIATDLPRFYPPTGEKRRQFNRSQIAEVTRLSHYPIIQLGHINPERWQRMHQTLMRAGLVRSKLDLNALIYDPNRDTLRTQKLVLIVLSTALLAALLAAAGIYGLNRVLAAKVRARTAALSESESRIRLITDSVPALIAYVDKDHRFRFNNKTYEEWFGSAPGEFIGKHIREPLGDEAYDKILPYVEGALAGEEQVFESEYPNQGAGKRFVHARYVPDFGENQEVIGFYAAIMDITEQVRIQEEVRDLNESLEQRVARRTRELRTTNKKLRQEFTERQQAEEKLRASEHLLETIFNVVPTPIFVKDLTSRHIMANAALSEMHDVPLEEILGRTSSEISRFNQDEGKVFDDQDRQVIETGEGLIVPEINVTDDRGQRRIRTIRKVPLRNDENQIIGVVGITEDITERKRAEAELRAAQKELLRGERLAAIGQVTATVTHELRNPLGAIRNSLNIIKRLASGNDPRLPRAVELAGRGITRCDGIISGLLDFTRDPELELRPTLIDDWLEQALGELEVPAGITLSREFTSGAEIAFDQERLRRAIINVIDNASQSMTASQEEAGGNLTVATRLHGERLEVVVSDTGTGIPEEELEMVFDPLFTTKSFGVGLGLPTVKRIMEQHGGGIEISSEAGSGTQVVLWLPYTS